MKLTIKRAQRKLDKLWRTKDKESARCEMCETLPVDERVRYSQLHPHHVIGKRNKMLRWDLRNRCWLCPTHHTLGNLSAHNDPIWFLGWFKRHRKKDYNYLLKKRNEILRIGIEDYKLMINDLQ